MYRWANRIFKSERNTDFHFAILRILRIHPKLTIASASIEIHFNWLKLIDFLRMKHKSIMVSLAFEDVLRIKKHQKRLDDKFNGRKYTKR